MAQNKSYTPSLKNFYGLIGNQPKAVSTLDTLGRNLLGADSLALYPSVSGGYVGGNNGFGDKGKAQVFLNDTVFGITKILFSFGAKTWGGNPASNLVVKIYKTNGVGKSTKSNAQIGAPNDIMAAQVLPFSSILANGSLTELILDYTLVVDTDFAAGISFEYLLPGDTIGLLTGYNGQADSTERAWEMLSSGTWSTLFRSWPLNADLAIFPVIDYYYTGVSVLKQFVQRSLFPNPGSGQFSVRPFKKGQNWKIIITDGVGKIVYGTEQPYSEFLPLNINFLSTGIYTLTSVIDGLAMQERLVIE